MLTTILLQTFLLTATPISPEGGADVTTSRLQLRLEEAKKGSVYLTFSEAELKVSIGNLDVLSIPVLKTETLGSSAQVTLSITKAVPASKFEPFVKEVDKLTVDTTGAVESVDEIQSVEDMPASFLITLSDGSYIWVESEDGEGLAERVRGLMLQVNALKGYLWADEASSPTRAIRIEMDPESARHLFWLARPGTAIIF